MSTRTAEASIVIPLLEEPAGGRTLAQKALGVFKSFGPGAILASISIGAGETIVAVRTGAWARYDLLWVVLVSCLVKAVLVTYMLGRYTALSGESIGQRLVRLPGPRGWLLLGVIGVEVLFAPLAWVAIARPCGNLIHELAGCGWSGCENVYTTLFIALALAVSLTHTYRRLEKAQLALCGVLVAGTLAGTLIVWPDIAALLEGTFLRIGRLPDSAPPWTPPDATRFPWLNLATVFAYIGGSVTGYIAYANWIGIRGWGLTGHPEIEAIRRRAARAARIDYLPEDPEQARRLLRLTSPMRWDIAQGAVVLFVVTAAFMISGAAALYDRQAGFQGWSLLRDQAHVWQNISPWLTPIYYGTVLAALFGTLTALPEVYARVTQEFLSAIWPERPWIYGRIRAAIAAAILVEAGLLVWVGLDFEILTQIAGFFLSNLAVAAMAMAGLYLNWVLPPRYRLRGLALAAAVAAAAVMAGTCAMSGLGLLSKLGGAL
ncbi:MAG: Nramp family divalent metal transporter [Planctomycetes bacterium]|nr:Nramp family divalent metal transporter [Planctomycetota bacterium]